MVYAGIYFYTECVHQVSEVDSSSVHSSESVYVITSVCSGGMVYILHSGMCYQEMVL